MEVATDLAKLSELTEDRILANLKTRFVNGLYYTFLGDVLVAVNPYQKTASNIEEAHSQYPGHANHDIFNGNAEAHVFWTVQQSYRELLSTSTQQCVLITGESGTGKTESAKLLIEHISYMSSCRHGQKPSSKHLTTDTSTSVHEKITRVFPLLEAFGNAVTSLNANSSRFGKLVELGISKDGALRNAAIHDYLLEKSRVVRQGIGERNFHIFYYMFAGFNTEQKVYYELGDVSDYRILRHGKEPAFSSNQISYLKSRYDHAVALMTYLGFNNDDINAVLSVLCAILHLSNIEFTAHGGMHGGGVEVSKDKALDSASNLLGIKTDQLGDALKANTIHVRGEAARSHQRFQQAEDGRDSLSEALYSRLFGWIVSRINLHLQTQDTRRDKVSSISILEFSGFECVQKNGFDQLSINAADEKLQQMFQQQIFTKEKNELLEDGINAPTLSCKDNQGLVDLLFQVPRGLFYLLDEESAIPQSSDRTLVSRLDASYSQSPHYLPSRGNSSTFSIVHYAKEVLYDAEGMLQQNVDNVRASLHQLMLQSRNSLVRTLFSTDRDPTGSFSRSFAASKARRDIQRSSQLPVGHHNQESAKSTASSCLRKSLSDLTSKLRHSKHWFIRCIKPNNNAAPNLFQDDLVLTQLRHSCLQEIAKIRRTGFPDRLAIGEFVRRYRDICFNKQARLAESRQEANTIVSKCNLRDNVFGNSKVFLRIGQKEILERMLGRRREEMDAGDERKMRSNRRTQEDLEIRNVEHVDNPQQAGKPGLIQELQQRTNERNIAVDDQSSNTSTVHRKVQDWMDVNDTPVKHEEEPWHGENGATVIEGSILSEETDAHLLDRNIWDRFLVVPRDNQEEHPNFQRAMKAFKVVCYVLIFVVVLTSAVATKLSILTLATGKLKTSSAGESDPKMTMLLIVMCFPYVTNILTYSSKSLFGGTGWPTFKMTLVILAIELGHTSGLCLLVFRVLPSLDMMRALIIVTSIFLGPALMKFVFTFKNIHSTAFGKCLRVMLGFLCAGVQILSLTCSSYIRFSMTSLEQHIVKRAGSNKAASIVQRPGSDEFTFVWEIPVALALISLVFWENFMESDLKLCGIRLPFNSWKKHAHSMRQRLYIVVSLWKITWSVLFAVLLIDGFDFSLTFPPPQDNHWDNTTRHLLNYGPLYIVLVGSVLCSYFSGLACKLNMQAVSFALPLMLVLPASFTVVFLRCRHAFLEVPDSPHLWVCAEDWSSILPYHWALLGAVWLSQLMLCTHVWQSKAERMAKIHKLFVTPIRCSILTGETLLLRRRTTKNEKILEKGIEEYSLFSGNSEHVVPQIYACATMWHETRQEMTKLLKSIFRMDIDHSARTIAQKYYKIKDPDYYEFEAHVFFDDAFDIIGDEVVKPNVFVARFIECLDEAISSVHERPTTMGPPVRTSVPYGGRLTWTLPGGTNLVVHLKDKSRIRNRKRWSQVMYLYYLLGYKLLAQYEGDPRPGQEEDSELGDQNREPSNKMRLTTAELRHRRKSAFFSRSVIFDYVAEDVKAQADSTYILTLDGDVDFKPEAVHLLVDRMKKNKKVGAACGRIHPVGSGPIIWYQQFEYAIGHWLQKAMEHVFGCVLCAPGCFSLFRGSALMDDNVARMYATRSTEAGHYVQFDQGEDRWLSTLLLQQGYRIDYCAASDAMTQAPETFNEFFNQRRRWGPSTLANLFDLLGSWKTTVHMNDNISTLYMLYQALMLSSSLLGPATVLLMMAGAYQVVFKVTVLQSYAISLGPAVAFLLVCMYTKINIQLSVGAVMSAAYAIVMTVVLVGTVGTAISGSVTSPNVIFMVLLGVVFVIAGILHPRELGCLVPGVLYFICIPAGYLVLTIYFLSNLHVVSWGTREISAPAAPEGAEKGEGKETNTEAKKKGKGGKKRKGLLEWLGVRQVMTDFLVMLRQLFDSTKLLSKGKLGGKTKKPGKQDRRRSSVPDTNELLQQLISEMRLSRGASSAVYDTHYAHTTSPVYGRSNDEIRRDSTDAYHVNDNDNDNEDARQSSSSSSDDGDGDDARESRLQAILVDDGESCSESTSRVPREDPDRPSWIHHPSMGHGDIGRLGERERVFWTQLMAKYLHPIVDEPHNKERIRKDLLFLRNNVVFAFFMTSAVWIALFMQLEILQNELKSHLFVHIPSVDGEGSLSFQPLGLIFLGCFSIILMLQFLGMFAHRWGTMLHTLSITDVGLGSRVKEQKKVKDIIVRVSNLQRLKHIDLEPEPDYEDPLPDVPVLDIDGSDHEVQHAAAHTHDNLAYTRNSSAEIHQDGFYLQERRTPNDDDDNNITFTQGPGVNMKYYSGSNSNTDPSHHHQHHHHTIQASGSGYAGSQSQQFYHPREMMTSRTHQGGSSMDAPPSYRTQPAVTTRPGPSIMAMGGSVRRKQWGGVLGFNNNTNMGNPLAYALEDAFEKRFRNEKRHSSQDYSSNHGHQRSSLGGGHNVYTG